MFVQVVVVLAVIVVYSLLMTIDFVLAPVALVTLLPVVAILFHDNLSNQKMKQV